MGFDVRIIGIPRDNSSPIWIINHFHYPPYKLRQDPRFRLSVDKTLYSDFVAVLNTEEALELHNQYKLEPHNENHSIQEQQYLANLKKSIPETRWVMIVVYEYDSVDIDYTHLKSASTAKAEITPPEEGDTIYVDTRYDFYNNIIEYTGGICHITNVSLQNHISSSDPYGINIKLKELPEGNYSYYYFYKQQQTLKLKFENQQGYNPSTTLTEFKIEQKGTKLFVKLTLFSQSKEEGIERKVTAEFQDPILIISGYDVGKELIQWWGKDEYEYSITINQEQLLLLAEILSIQPFNIENLLARIYTQYHSATCFEDIRKLLEENKILFQSNSYPL